MVEEIAQLRQVLETGAGWFSVQSQRLSWEFLLQNVLQRAKYKDEERHVHVLSRHERFCDVV